MYNECQECQNNIPPFQHFNPHDEIWWWSWESGHREKIDKDGKYVKYKVTQREVIQSTAGELVEKVTTGIQLYQGTHLIYVISMKLNAISGKIF